jgi:hypothetical protein
MALRLGCVFAIAAMALGAPLAPRSAGGDGFPLSTPGSDGWRPLVFRGIANQTRYTLEFFEGMEVARAESDCGASGLVLRLDAIRLDQTPLLSWRWRVDRGLDLLQEQTKEEIPGSALNFVWTSRLPAGTVWDNPFESSAKMIALAQGANQGWRTETVDVVARYRELFRSPVPPALGLAVMSDSDNSCQRTEARFADFKFLNPTGLDERDAE